MISLEKAKKLKEAGLEWEPQIGDWFVSPNRIVEMVTKQNHRRIFTNFGSYPMRQEALKEMVLVPRLEQLLAKIRELGYKWFLETDTERYFIRVVEIKKPNNFHVIFSDSPANAAASALLWIYEGRAKA